MLGKNRYRHGAQKITVAGHKFVVRQEIVGLTPSRQFTTDWVDYSEKKLKTLHAQVQVPAGPFSLPISLRFAHEYSENITALYDGTNPVHIVDYAGGVGQSLPIIWRLSIKDGQYVPFNSTVIDNEQMCERGRKIWETLDAKKKVSFHSSLKNCNSPCDLFMCVVSLFYVTDLSEIISYLEMTRPKYIFFVYVLVNFEGGSLSLAQTISDKEYIDVMAHSVEKLVSTLGALGYEKKPDVNFYSHLHEADISEKLSKAHPEVRMTDLYFVHLGE